MFKYVALVALGASSALSAEIVRIGGVNSLSGVPSLFHPCPALLVVVVLS